MFALLAITSAMDLTAPVEHADGSKTFTVYRDQTQGSEYFKVGGYMSAMNSRLPMEIGDIMRADMRNPTGFRHPGLDGHEGWRVTHVNGVETPLSYDANRELDITKENYTVPFTLTLRPPTAEERDGSAGPRISIGAGGITVGMGTGMSQLEMMQVLAAMTRSINSQEQGGLGQVLGVGAVTGLEMRSHLSDSSTGERLATVRVHLPPNFFEELLEAEELLSPGRQQQLEAAREEARARDSEYGEIDGSTGAYECPVCMFNQAKVVLQPCNHLATCNECHVRMQYADKLRCPICRSSPTGHKQAADMTAAGEDFFKP